MRRFGPAAFAWGWFVLVVALAAALISFARTRWDADLQFLDPTGLPILFVGALIASRRPDNPIGLLLILSGTAFTLPWTLFMEAAFSDPAVVGPLRSWLALLVNIVFVPQLFPILFVLLLFPTGRVPGPRWRWVSAYGASVGILIVLFLVLRPELIAGEVVVRNPASPLAGAWIERFATVLAPALVAFVIACAAAPFVRYRSAGPTERAQIRWLLYAGALFTLSFILIAAVGFDRAGPWWWTLWGVSVMTIPIAIGIAILRHRLFDIDVIIRRTLQYGVLTAILGGLYFGSVLLFQTLLGPLVGGADSPLVVIVTTLVLAALFNPLRLRVQRFIDRRFYRSKVDAERALAQFAALARDELDLEQLRRALLGTVGEMLHPERMGLWLRATEKGGSGSG